MKLSKLLTSPRRALIKPLLVIALVSFLIALLLSLSQKLKSLFADKPLTTEQKLLSDEPKLFVEGLLELQDSSQLSQYLCCEASSGKAEDQASYVEFLRKSASPEYQRELMTLNHESDKAAVSLEITQNTEGTNWYLYLHKQQGSWKLGAVRSLALTGLYYQLIDDYEHASESERQQMREVVGNAQLNMMYRTAKLVTATDTQIARHFADNKDGYKDLLERVKKYEVISGGTFQLSDHDKDVMNNLAISFISTGEYTDVSCDDCYFFLVGGMVDNALGFAYIPNQHQVPFPDGKNFIMFRSLGEGWYIYKTT